MSVDIVGRDRRTCAARPSFSRSLRLAIKLTDGGKVLIVQRRVGLDNACFSFFKFRSMVSNAEELRHGLECENVHSGGTGITFKIKERSAVTHGSDESSASSASTSCRNSGTSSRAT